jgi:16S rRNA (guanine527-N7)-methyltransferase
VAVSRETDAPSDALLRRLFPGDKAIRRFVDLLTTIGVDRGLIGPRETQRIWSRHILNCAVVEQVVPREAHVVDIGSGAGLPGVVIAIARPDLRVTLVEPMLRRCRFLAEVIAALSLDQVEVIRARAEDLIGTATFDVATARAVAPLNRLVPWALPLCKKGGELVAMKGAGAADELSEARDAIADYGGTHARIERVGVGLVEPPPTVVRIQSIGQVSASGKGRR